MKSSAKAGNTVIAILAGWRSQTRRSFLQTVQTARTKAWSIFISLSSHLMRERLTPQCDGREKQATKRVSHQDERIAHEPIRIQGKVVEGVLQHHDGVIDGKQASDQLLDRREKRDRA